MRWAPGFKVKFSSLQGMQQECHTTGTASGGMNDVQRVIGTTHALPRSRGWEMISIA
jgi:hypothetical protein